MIYEEDYFTKTTYKPYQDFPVHQFRAKKLVAMFHPTSVLDVGCAYGYIVKYLLDMGVEAFGIDISKWAIEQSQKIVPGHCSVHDMREPLPFNDKQFQLLYCEGVLEHIEEEAIPAMMKEFDRVAYCRMLQISLSNHPNCEKEEGHICLHDANWWAKLMPYNTYLALQNTGSEDNYYWLYKG